MSDARVVADRLTKSIETGDLSAVTSCYGSSAVLVAPEGRYTGREQIRDYFAGWIGPFTDFTVEVVTKAEWDGTAFDEWILNCTNAGDLTLPTGEVVPATGKRLTIRGADVCTVEGDLVTEHHIYYDQVEVLGQLDLPAS